MKVLRNGRHRAARAAKKKCKYSYKKCKHKKYNYKKYKYIDTNTSTKMADEGIWGGLRL